MSTLASTPATARYRRSSGGGAAPRSFGLDELWTACACGGGQLLLPEFTEVLRGARGLSDLERAILTAALESRF